MGDTNSINFYREGDAYGCFSNFSKHAITLKDKRWATSEHYFQAQKFAGTHYEEQVRATETPGQSAKMGRNRSLPLRKDWEKVKEGIMKDALIAKFTQHEDIKQTLLGTGNKYLCEHTTNDSYWGDGGDGSGKNRLGFLLMEVREMLRAGEVKVDVAKPSTEEVEESSGDSQEDVGDEDEGEEGLEPNQNHMFEAGPSAEKQTNGLKKKVRRTSKSRSKRGVYRDADGNSTLEKTTDKKGSVTVIGEGTVFSEKALPPQAKFVVNKHQMQRKYHPTEKDFSDDVDDDPTPVTPNKKTVMADFFTVRGSPPKSEQSLPTDDIMNASECMESTRNTLELLSQVTEESEMRRELLENAKALKANLSRCIEEMAEREDGGGSSLVTAMELFEKLQLVL